MELQGWDTYQSIRSLFTLPRNGVDWVPIARTYYKAHVSKAGKRYPLVYSFFPSFLLHPPTMRDLAHYPHQGRLSDENIGLKWVGVT